MKITPAEGYDTAKYTLRALLTVMNNVSVFDEEGPDTVNMHGLQSWATRLRQRINDTEVSWHIVSDEDGLVDISRSVSFLTPNGEPINHTTLLRQVDLGETSRQMFSSFICQLIIGLSAVPMASRKEAKEWEKVAAEDANYVFRTGLHHAMTHPQIIVMREIVIGEESPSWGQLDVLDRFNLIHQWAEESVGHALGRHKAMWSQEGVVFDSADVYYEAWYTEASRLIDIITSKAA